MRRHRWYGTPGEEQPDVGDVLAYTRADLPDYWRVVHGSTPVRGRTEEHLWLMVTRHDIVGGYGIPDEVAAAMDAGGSLFVAREGRPELHAR